MHLYVLTRGIKPATKQWENDLLAQHLPMEILMKGKNGKLKKKPTKCSTQLQVRPVNLYEIVFPEESLQDVLGMVRPSNQNAGKFSKFISMFSRMMGLKKIPDYKCKQLPLGNGVSVIGLGLKKDKMNWTRQDQGNGVFNIGLPKEQL